MEKTWRTVIVDDERLARNKLRTLLSSHSAIQLVGEADSVAQAIDVIGAQKPEVMFLDIQMPRESGFDLLGKIDLPLKVIFVTAFDEYAIRAFEVNALDYLLKPVNPERLAKSIERLSCSDDNAEQPPRKLDYDDHLFITIDNHSIFLRINTIKLINAAGVYSEVCTLDGKRLLVLKSLREWEARLPEKFFVRIHRSAIINVGCVLRVEKRLNRSYQIYLRDSKEPLPMSRRHATHLRNKLK